MLFFLLVLKAHAQEPSSENKEKGCWSRISYSVTAGFNAGGLSPVPLPNNIRKIMSYDPMVNPSLGIEALYPLNERWSIGINPRFDYKGMKVKDSVMYFHTLIQMGEGDERSSFEGDFTGINYTESRNLYLSLPFFITFTPKEKWHYRLGGYAAFRIHSRFKGYVSDGYIRNGNSLGEKINVTRADFDFSDKVRKVDCGIYAGVKRDLGNNFSVGLNLQWGLISAFPKSFTGIAFPMYNIYGQLAVGYGF